jgi:hypothetical protein
VYCRALKVGGKQSVDHPLYLGTMHRDGKILEAIEPVSVAQERHKISGGSTRKIGSPIKHKGAAPRTASLRGFIVVRNKCHDSTTHSGHGYFGSSTFDTSDINVNLETHGPGFAPSSISTFPPGTTRNPILTTRSSLAPSSQSPSRYHFLNSPAS